MMDVDEFWMLVDDACAEIDATVSDFDERYDAVVRACENRLVTRTPEEIVEFAIRQWQLRDQAYQWRLWGAAYLIEGGCSDDAFMDFREGVISLGREWYERVLADPDTLADHPAVMGGGDVLIGNEDFGYIANNAYERRTGERDGLNVALDAAAEAEPLRAIVQPAGERWDFDDDHETRRRLPRLSAIFLD